MTYFRMEAAKGGRVLSSLAYVTLICRTHILEFGFLRFMYTIAHLYLENVFL